MQNETDFFYDCKKFEYNQDFGIVFQKRVDALLVFVILDLFIQNSIRTISFRSIFLSQIILYPPRTNISIHLTTEF